MQGSIDRVRTVINGGTPDRAPLYDLFRNDVVISYFAGETLTVENGSELVYHAYEPALDATRPSVRAPDKEHVETLTDGRERRYYRWTTWTERVSYANTAAYAAAKRTQINAFDPTWTAARQTALDNTLAAHAEARRKLGEVFFFPGIPGTSLMGIIGEIGLEPFCYCLVDCPGIVTDLLRCNVANALVWAEHLPENHGIEAGFLGDDIAFNTGSFLSPVWMREHYFPCLKQIIDAYHRRGIKVLFHSDGNLNSILGDLVEAGIDGLNPIEILAGMDVGDIHRRFPHLFMCGAVDVSQLLPFGTPQQVKDTVRRTVDAAEGRIMVGSSTELNNEVPLENYLALRDAVLEG